MAEYTLPPDLDAFAEACGDAAMPAFEGADFNADPSAAFSEGMGAAMDFMVDAGMPPDMCNMIQDICQGGFDQHMASNPDSSPMDAFDAVGSAVDMYMADFPGDMPCADCAMDMPPMPPDMGAFMDAAPPYGDFPGGENFDPGAMPDAWSPGPMTDMGPGDMGPGGPPPGDMGPGPDGPAFGPDGEPMGPPMGDPPNPEGGFGPGPDGPAGPPPGDMGPGGPGGPGDMGPGGPPPGDMGPGGPGGPGDMGPGGPPPGDMGPGGPGGPGDMGPGGPPPGADMDGDGMPPPPPGPDPLFGEGGPAGGPPPGDMPPGGPDMGPGPGGPGGPAGDMPPPDGMGDMHTHMDDAGAHHAPEGPPPGDPGGPMPGDMPADMPPPPDDPNDGGEVV